MKANEKEKHTPPELLAPAGSWDALRAAVGAGADAVYLAGKRFGARAYADNFDDEQLLSALEYAHRADVRVYVTVNTLLDEQELRGAGKFLLFLYEQGVDGVLVQDPGLISLARKRIPGLPLHASTQMTLHNSAGVRWASEAGLNRVVLARELGTAEIKKIAHHLHQHGIGLEIFIHGALCYSYSGQCLLSSVIGGRSGNRGRCAQPCRKSYVLAHGPTDAYNRSVHHYPVSAPSYCLSTRDLCTYLHFDEIMRLPVDALKIEGRMKSAEYVATVVRIYRSAIDGIMAGTWSPSDVDLQDLLLAFNRGFTGGHLFGEPVLGAAQPDHQGLWIGMVLSYDPEKRSIKVRLSGNTVPEKGDGIFLLSGTGEEKGMRLNRSPYRSGSFLYLSSPESVTPDTSVYITSRASLDRAASEAMKHPFYRPILVEVDVSWRRKKVVFQGHLHRRREDIPVRYESSLEWEDARKQHLTSEQITTQLQKSGGTPFALQVRELRYPGGLFLPLSGMNAVRREFLSHLESLLHSSHRPPGETVEVARGQIDSYRSILRPSVESTEPALSTCVHGREGVKAAIAGGADSVCLEGGPREISASVDFCREKRIPLIWIWPRIARETMMDEWLTGLAHLEPHLAGVMVAGAGMADAIRRQYPFLALWGSVDLNIWNHCAIQAFAPLFRTLLLSPELSLNRMRELILALPPDAPTLGCFVQGNLEVMISENCPDERVKISREEGWGLLDARDRFFPLTIDDWGRTHIYNAVETSYIDHLHALRNAGIGTFLIDGRYRSPRYVREITTVYREGLRRVRNGEADCSDLKEKIQKRARGGITLGPLIKDLKEEL
ncbi:MAG: DUF3656 domain-containing protein [Methanomicrobiales archaeon]|nr:DUF3656 domain-containing protein [Methanomicrobiales archaeon]